MWAFIQCCGYHMVCSIDELLTMLELCVLGLVGGIIIFNVEQYFVEILNHMRFDLFILVIDIA